MADEVVDIRKRIEEMRNEVSAAIVSRQELNDTTRAIGDIADISLGTQAFETAISATNDSNGPMHNVLTSASSHAQISDDMINKHKGLETALKMPTLQLNVRNQTSNNLLLAVIGIQLLTNILLILMVWTKLG